MKGREGPAAEGEAGNLTETARAWIGSRCASGPIQTPIPARIRDNFFWTDQRRRNHWLIRSHQPVTERPCSIRSPLLAGCWAVSLPSLDSSSSTSLSIWSTSLRRSWGAISR